LVRLTPEERSTAVRAARIMGLNVCGVDILRSNHGPVIMEVNSSPGLQGIENASGKDIADLIIQFIEKRIETLETAKDKSSANIRTRTRGKG
jgi:ribosomal protein S6--L-glutamate ligase